MAITTERITDLEQIKIRSANTWKRRYDVDWLRTLAMALLIIYHVGISFQPWGRIVEFPQTDQTIEFLWIGMSLVNIWRIPILFMISGMGVRFAMERRNWKELLKDRAVRILLPFVFGFFFITPFNAFAYQAYYDLPLNYESVPGHLWFLPYIFLYVILLLPFLYILKNRPDNWFLGYLSKLFQRPAALLLLTIPLMVESFILDPGDFINYQLTIHGFFLGLILFFTGFLFVSLKDIAWPSAEKIRWITLTMAFPLYVGRGISPEMRELTWLTAFESVCWMLAIIGFASVYLNNQSKSLTYFSKAVYPVYIVHLPVQFGLAIVIFSLPLTGVFQLFLLLLGTFGLSLLLYEMLKRIKWIRPLFGMKLNHLSPP
jgi:surface polysaccharide O-acyltransferase-like enzyme